MISLASAGCPFDCALTVFDNSNEM